MDNVAHGINNLNLDSECVRCFLLKYIFGRVFPGFVHICSIQGLQLIHLALTLKLK